MLRLRGEWLSRGIGVQYQTVGIRCIERNMGDCSIATGADSKIARQEQGESTWDPLNACELAPNSANSLIPSLIAWAKSQPPGNVAIVSKYEGHWYLRSARCRRSTLGTPRRLSARRNSLAVNRERRAAPHRADTGRFARFGLSRSDELRSGDCPLRVHPARFGCDNAKSRLMSPPETRGAGTGSSTTRSSGQLFTLIGP